MTHFSQQIQSPADEGWLVTHHDLQQPLDERHYPADIGVRSESLEEEVEVHGLLV